MKKTRSDSIVRQINLFSIGSILLLGFITVLILFIQNGNQLSKQIEEQKRTTSSWMSAMINYQYGIGNLVELRRSMNFVAMTQPILQANFINYNNQKIWEYDNQKLKGCSDSTLNRFILSTLTAKNQVSKTCSGILFETSINNPNGESIGTLTFALDFSSQLNLATGQIKSVSGFFIFLLLAFVFLNQKLSKRILSPLTDLSENIEKKIKEIADTEVIAPSENEVTRLTRSFDQLWSVWEKAEIDSKNKTRQAAVGATTQMLAHDIRKPFTMISGMLEIFQNTPDGDQIKTIAKKFSPEIKRAIASVNGMIDDVMEVSSSRPLVQEATRPESLILTSLTDSFRINIKSKILITYDFKHSKEVNIDSQKILRALTNIIVNAIQAMKNNGSIWFHTRDRLVSNQEFVEITIGNGNSYIESDDLALLFDAFYTKGKRTGTGLGLAIAQKVLMAHGGTIQCRSDQERGTEFILTLPAADSAPYSPIALIESNSSMFGFLETKTEPSLSDNFDPASELGKRQNSLSQV